MRPRIKICGITRPVDARRAASLGASWVGVIFAGGPRLVTATQAAAIVDAAGGRPVVGVFGNQGVDDICALRDRSGISVVQLHGAHDASTIAALRARMSCEIWSVVRTTGALPRQLPEAALAADVLVVDSLSRDALGGTGVRADWVEMARSLTAPRPRPLALAGGLDASNVQRAVEVLQPDILDVSSGVETAPGIKSPERLSAFFEAAWRVAIP